ncbi:SRPBCC family protein [Staphylococcus caledonicus]|uniref:SRPBCC family protein n=1 Tax=Staphylococcus caledonicus TaxID=2741333 RepID=UPI0018E49A4C|nr:SRPBCC domain-containing protein [Staphylococcus caledonicus]MBI5973229.1 SRPBCC domain-containing protein [Staphylococcus caledonicus]
MTIEVKDNKIIFTRTFDAPINEVFKAYTTKELFEQWFHPQGAKTKVFKFNAVEGGEAFFAIETSEHTSYTLTEYKTIDQPNHIEYLDFFATPQGEKDTRLPGMQVYLDFDAQGDERTTITSTSVFPTKEAAEGALNMGVEAGMNATLDQLDTLLKNKKS